MSRRYWWIQARPPQQLQPASASGLHSRRPSWMPKGDDSPSTSYTSYTEHILAKRLYIHVNAKTWLGGWAIQTHSFEKRNWYIDHVDCLIVRVAMQHGIFSSDSTTSTSVPLLPSIQGDLFGFQSNGPQVPRLSVSLPYIYNGSNKTFDNERFPMSPSPCLGSM